MNLFPAYRTSSCIKVTPAFYGNNLCVTYQLPEDGHMLWPKHVALIFEYVK